MRGNAIFVVYLGLALVVGGQCQTSVATTPEGAMFGVANILVGIFWMLWVIVGLLSDQNPNTETKEKQ